MAYFMRKVSAKNFTGVITMYRLHEPNTTVLSIRKFPHALFGNNVYAPKAYAIELVRLVEWLVLVFNTRLACLVYSLKSQNTVFFPLSSLFISESRFHENECSRDVSGRRV